MVPIKSLTCSDVGPSSALYIRPFAQVTFFSWSEGTVFSECKPRFVPWCFINWLPQKAQCQIITLLFGLRGFVGALYIHFFPFSYLSDLMLLLSPLSVSPVSLVHSMCVFNLSVHSFIPPLTNFKRIQSTLFYFLPLPSLLLLLTDFLSRHLIGLVKRTGFLVRLRRKWSPSVNTLSNAIWLTAWEW